MLLQLSFQNVLPVAHYNNVYKADANCIESKIACKNSLAKSWLMIWKYILQSKKIIFMNFCVGYVPYKTQCAFLQILL